jgi:hypothetical protein
MGIVSPIKETSGKSTSVIDSTHCVYKEILCYSVVDHVNNEVLNSLDGQLKIIIDPILYRRLLRRYISQCCLVSRFSVTFPAHSGPRPLFQFRNNFSQTVGLLGWVISPSHGLYLNTWRHKHRINAHTPNIHTLSGIRTHDPSVRER